MKKWRVKYSLEAFAWMIFYNNHPFALAGTWREAMAFIEFEEGQPAFYGNTPWRVTCTNWGKR